MLTNELYFVLPAVLMAFLIASLLVPVLNSVADKISNRKTGLSNRQQPKSRAAGGIGMATAVILSFQLWSISDIQTFHPYFFASLALFLISGYISGRSIVASMKRVGIQFSAAVVLVVGVSGEVGGFLALMGLGGFSSTLSIIVLSGILTSIAVLFNYMGRAPELIGGVAIIATSVLGIWFWAAGFFNMALFSFVVSSSLIGYMMCRTNLKSVELGRFGWGSMGFVVAFLMMEFMLANASVAGQGVHLVNGIGLMLALLIIPMVVWGADLVTGKKRLLRGEGSGYFLFKLYSRLGMDRNQTSFLFWMVNLIVVGVAYSTMHLSGSVQAIILIGFGVFYTTAIYKTVLISRGISKKLSGVESAWVRNWIRD